jgi:serine/threonine-protein kinase
MIGQYRIKNLIGAGGMGIVYAAEHTLIGRPAAVKVLLPEFSHNQSIVARFFNEAKAATAIRHPGIVEIFDFGWHTDGSAYIVMEFLDGETLGARRKRGQMSLAAALTFIRQIARALAAAHGKGIVHRDLKPDNIFIVPDPENPQSERIKLLDFGIAKLAGENTNQNRTRTGAVIGTPTYMSPEQCRGVAVDHRADLYSLGVILYKLLAGRAPFVGEGEGDVLAAHIHVPPPLMSSFVPNIPPAVEQLVQRLLQKAPADRPQTADEVVAMIDAAMGNVVEATPKPPPGPVPAPSGPFAPLPSIFPTPSSPTQPTTLSGAAGNTPVPTEPRRSGKTAMIAALVASGIAGIVIAFALSHANKSAGPRPSAAIETHAAAAESAPAAAAESAPAPAPEATPATAAPTPAATPAPATPTPAATPAAVPEAAPATPPPSEDKPVAAVETPPTVALDLVTNPWHAEVWLGTTFVGSTPIHGTLAAGDAAVKLTVKKPGYKDQVISVVPSAAIDLHVDLHALPKQTTKSNRDQSVNPF